ncbi:hypothetical protein PoB_003373900 [Plakobranchus ocellatus]|uniref:Uncharacterized protein n=1 Tax=Plakobranchus ocellatus TaxID=259542 RepID=A0AAV4AHS4_9GAST|nr:hypothetical protein PoB_003373900 [Plakobranchus ocellatus]
MRTRSFSIACRHTHLTSYSRFKTMKAEWKLAVKRQNETEIVTKRTFAKTFKDAYERTVARPLCEKAFKSCGIYPFDPNSIEWSKVLPSNDEYSAPPPAQTQHPVTSTPVSTPPAACSTPTAMGSPAVSSTPTAIAPPSVCSTPTAIAPPAACSTPTAIAPPAACSTPTGIAPPAVCSISSAIALTAACYTRSTPTITVPHAAQAHCPGGSGSVISITSHHAHSSSCLDGDTDPTSTLRKFAMICSQIGDATLHTYYTRLEEGYDLDEPLYVLWRSYHTELISLMTTPKVSVNANTCTSVSDDKATDSARSYDPLAIPTVKKGAKRVKKTLKLPALISSPDFRNMLLQKEADEKAEEARKKQRKLDMEEKKKSKAKEEELKKTKREQSKKEREEKKRLKDIEVQLRKEERKRKQEEKKKTKRKGRRKKSVGS